MVLGPVGDNFAAGMTGGVAFVLDGEDKLPERLNPEHVELSPLGDLEDECRAFVTQHFEATGSVVAETLLSDWDEKARQFKVVAPKGWRDAGAGSDRAAG